MAQSFESWWGTLGPITKIVLVLSIGITTVASSGVVSPYKLIVDFNTTIFSFQLWRIVTAAFYLGNFSFPWLMALAMLVTYVKHHEETEFQGRRADFVWMLVLIITFLTLVAWALALPLVSFALTMSLCWIFCKRNPTAKLSIYFFEFNANIFPWALMAFHVVLGQSVLDDVAGIVAGHGYIFLSDMLPKTHGMRLVETPEFLKRWIPNQRLFGSVHNGVQAVAPAGRQPLNDQPARRNWGQGRVLGAQ
jgi:Derlin-2/3